MEKISVSLPVPLKRALARAARQRRGSEAALVREAIARLTNAPRLPLFRSRGASIAGNLDRALKDFGRR
jgi:Arc/MetJ-type ribon-helix-helix transcriptional regulator